MLNLWLCITYMGLIFSIAVDAKANPFCFALAESYYEQIYCELEVKAQTKSLPSFQQFRKNSEQVQALLIKRLAMRNNIKLPLPRLSSLIEPAKLSTESTEGAGAPVEPSASMNPRGVSYNELSPIEVASGDLATCVLMTKTIECGSNIYRLLGNRANSHLAPDALMAQNLMALPEFQGQNQAEYLIAAYRLYIEKMHAIGLAGVTMTYGKFTYLFKDVEVKGLNFSQRFEKMYSFLKKDKATMGVSEAVVMPSGLNLVDCQNLTATRIVCALAGRNYIFGR